MLKWLLWISIGFVFIDLIVQIFIEPIYEIFRITFCKDFVYKYMCGNTEVAKYVFKLLKDCAISCICGWVIYLVTVRYPSWGNDISKKEYALDKFKEISKDISRMVSLSVFLRIEKTTPNLQDFIKFYLSHNGSSYKTFNDISREVREVATSLLKDYASYFSYDQIEQLKYLKNNFVISEPPTQCWFFENNDLKYNEDYLKSQAVQFYKAYDILQKEKFEIPKYECEEEIDRNFRENYDL